MKRLMWLSTPAHERMLEDCLDEKNFVSHFYNLEQMTSLTSFVRRAKTIAEQNYILIDLEHWSCEKEQLIEAVQMLRRLTAARLVFLVSEQDKDLQLALASEEVMNVIIMRPETDLASELQLCIGVDGKGFSSRTAALQNGLAAQAKAQMQVLHIPQSLRMICTVAGTMPRIGTTTQSLALCRYLTGLGFRPLLVDETGALWEAVQLAYPDRIAVHAGFLEVDGVSISTQICQEESFNAYVLDLGVLDEQSAQVFRSDAHLRLLVSGIKPWELQPFALAKSLLRDTDHATVVSFGTEQELQRLQRYFGASTGLAPWNPEPLNIAADCKYLSTVLLPRIRELCHAP